MSFSENLKQIRKEHHLSQDELAELLDVSRQAVSKWEQGQGYPEVEKLLLLSSKLNISLDALMSVEMNRDAGVKKENISLILDRRRNFDVISYSFPTNNFNFFTYCQDTSFYSTCSYCTSTCHGENVFYWH